MRIIAKGTLRDYWENHPQTEHALLDWYHVAKEANWNSPQDVKATYGNVSVVANNRLVFNIKGNDHRLVVEGDYRYQILFVVWLGSHAEYDKIDVTTVEYKKSD